MFGSIPFLALTASVAAGAQATADSYHKTSETVDYKCLFNHELLIVCHKKDISPEYIASFISLFNYDYVPANQRLAMVPGLRRITDVEHLKTKPKHYVVSSGFGSLPKTNEAAIKLVVPDDTAEVTFDRAVLRVETQESCAGFQIAVRLNGEQLEPCEHRNSTLFPPLAQNAGYAAREALKFYSVPLCLLVPGDNKVEITNLDKPKTSCKFVSISFRAMQYNLVVSTNDGAIRLWKRHGFEVVGTLPRAYRHSELGFVDAFVMFKQLEE